MQIGDIWWIPFPYADAPQYKTRPVLIVGASPMGSGEEEVLLTAMISSQIAKRRNGDILIANYSAAGLTSPSMVKARRLYSASPLMFTNSSATRAGRIDSVTFNAVLAEIANLF